MAIEVGREVLETGELLAFQSGLRLGEDFRIERHLELQQVPQEARQVDAFAVAVMAMGPPSGRA